MLSKPGIVRRLWWRTSQRARLAVTCLGMLTALVTTAAAGLVGDEREVGNGPGVAVHRGDAFEVTVQSVSDVDSFDGREPTTGLLVRARVAGLRTRADCWLAESRATAQDLLRGKTVRLVVKRDSRSGSDRIPVDVQLPDGSDYARTVVHEGAASVDLSARGELWPVESSARQEGRGVWSTDCAFGQETTTTSTTTSSSAPTSTTTTTTVPTTTESAPPPVTTTHSPPPDEDDDVDDARLGRRCLFEGARRKMADGGEMVCARNGRNQLRWQRAD